MIELNTVAVLYALKRMRLDMGVDIQGAQEFIEYYEDYERDSWLTTQE